jgi:peptidyl-prolyl cis-trans isomerase C
MVAAAPIQSPAGWHVIKVDDVRPFKIPSFEEARPQIRQALLVQRRQAFVDGLLKGANIQRP